MNTSSNSPLNWCHHRHLSCGVIDGLFILSHHPRIHPGAHALSTFQCIVAHGAMHKWCSPVLTWHPRLWDKHIALNSHNLSASSFWIPLPKCRRRMRKPPTSLPPFPRSRRRKRFLLIDFLDSFLKLIPLCQPLDHSAALLWAHFTFQNDAHLWSE